MNTNKPFIIGIAGGSGSGKTTVAQTIVAELSTDKVLLIAHDNYYRDQSHKPMDQRVLTNYDHPDSLETELLVTQIQQLLAGKSVEQPTYDFVNHTRSEKTLTLSASKIIVIEGILIFENKALRDLMNLRVFVDTDADIRFIRRLTRDIQERGRTAESVIEQYLSTVKPMHEDFVEPSKRVADIIIPEGGHNTRAIELLLSRIRGL